MKQKLKTLLVLTPGFPKDENDSTCIPPQQQFVKSLKVKFPNLHVIVLAFQYPFVKSEYSWNQVSVIAFGGQSRPRLSRLAIWIRVWRRLLQFHKEYEIIGLLSFWLGECAFIADLFSKYYKIKHYCWLLGQDARAGNKYVRWMNADGDNLIALSDFLVEEFQRNYKITPKHIIPVGITPSLFQPLKTGRDITLFGAGSLIRLKQFDLFIQVVKILKTEFPALNAMICGSGPEMENLQTLCEKSGLKEVLLLTGELSHTEVLALMQRTRIFIHTSEYEGFGAVCLEALYAGAKVISFVKPMNENINGWYIAENVQDMAGIASGILKSSETVFNSVMPFEIGENAEKMMTLFNYNEAAI